MIETNDSLYVHAALQTPEHFGDDFKEVINASFLVKVIPIFLNGLSLVICRSPNTVIELPILIPTIILE